MTHRHQSIYVVKLRCFSRRSCVISVGYSRRSQLGTEQGVRAGRWLLLFESGIHVNERRSTLALPSEASTRSGYRRYREDD